MLGGIPLIAYTIRDALAINGITKVLVNTDDPMIQEVAIQYGAEVPFLRPSELAGDDSDLGHASTYCRNWLQKHEGFDPDIYIIMSPTNPFRRKNIINDSLRRALSEEQIFNIGSVAQAHVSPDNLWVFKKNQLQKFTHPTHESVTPYRLCQSSMSFNIVFKCRAKSVMHRHTPVILNDIETIDIDEPIDLKNAQAVLDNNLYPVRDFNNNVAISQEKNSLSIFNKTFTEPPVSDKFRIIKHPDFPLLNQEEVQTFADYAKKQNKIVMTGCPARVHPYRLKYVNQQGFSDFFYEVDQAIRGNRHLYPYVFSFVPAMIAIPAGIDIQAESAAEMLMYKLPADRLLDLSIPLERLLIGQTDMGDNQ